MVSIVIPSYNEELMIETTAETVAGIMEQADIPYEMLFVDDGSTDDSWQTILRASERDYHVRGVRFSRNFGKEAAIFAGLAESTGDCTVVMDCDLQHPPEKIVEMYRLWEQGYAVVEGVKASRGKESVFYGFCAGMFYKIMSKAAKVDMRRASDFKLMDKKVVKAILRCPEKSVFFRALSSWVGFPSVSIEFDVQERVAGISKWSGKSLFVYAITNIVSFSTAPLQFVSIVGFVTMLFAIVMGIQSLIKYFNGQALEGFTTVILLILIIGSVLMISLGLIGYYLAKIYEEIKGRPRYLISEKR